MILDRELLEDPMYLSERFTRMQALIDLCFLAASKPRTIFIRGNKVEIGKGQVSESEESLARRWQWSRNTVRKFLSELENSGIIEQQKSRVITLISVKKYLIVEQQNEQQIEQQNEQPINNNKVNIIDKGDNKEKENNNISLADFEVCWKAYNRKGSKKKSLEQWQKLTDEERLKVLPHVKAYVGSRDLQFQRDFERYLRDKTFEEVIIKGNDTIYDPDKFDKTNEYHPTTDGIFQYWNDERKCLMFNGYIDQLNDGYTDDTRPDGAKVAWSMYEWEWSSRTKQWIKQND